MVALAHAAFEEVKAAFRARGAAHVVTVSEFSRAEIVELLGVPAGRVSVIGGGVDKRFRPSAAGASGAPYVLSVASSTARKNLRALGPASIRLAALGLHLTGERLLKLMAGLDVTHIPYSSAAPAIPVSRAPLELGLPSALTSSLSAACVRGTASVAAPSRAASCWIR